ncbi:MAG: integrase family protein [Alphaproteobacteria bacterium]|nr:integrase family protein [Alphaproteobacteria bacterium]
MAHQFFFNPYILDNLPTPVKGFDVVQDMSEPRLRMYITSRGIKTFFVRKRVHGTDKRILIGNYPDMDIEEARSAVQGVLDNALKKPVVRRKKITFKEFFDLYVANRIRRSEDSQMKLVRSVNMHLQPLMDKPIDGITREDVADVISAIDGAAIASRMQDLLQSIFKYAIEQGYVKQNVAAGLPKIEQKRRVRPLNRSGLQRLVAAINKEEDEFIRASFLMLVYGFAPRSKVFAMQWEDLDFNHYMWKDWPLSDRAVVLLQDLPQDSFWLFPGRGGSHLADPRTAWHRVARAAGVPNLTMDDVYKFLMRQLTWASDREEIRTNMNNLLDEMLDEY